MAGGLRQQQHGRTASMGQMPSNTLQGGAQGRGKLAHNGMRTTTGGGVNAKGSGMAAGAAKKPDFWNAPAGFFQFGHNQWGFINDRGMLNFAAKQPPKGAKIYGWNQIATNMKKRGIGMENVPTQQATPNPFIDDLYTRNMAQHDLDLNTAVQGADHNVKMLDFELGKERDDSERTFKTDRETMGAQLGAAGIDGSGVAAGTMGLAADEFRSFLDNLVEEHGSKVAKERADQQLARTAYDTTKTSELGLAKDRWTLEHPGAKLPAVRKGAYHENGQWYYANPNTGVTTTLKPNAQLAATVKPKPKPKHPNAKTYTVNGQVRQIRR